METYHAETPVSIGCDHPGCPVRDFTMALAFDRPDDIADVQARALAAAIEIATGNGWRIRIDGPTVYAWCPTHATPRLVLA